MPDSHSPPPYISKLVASAIGSTARRYTCIDAFHASPVLPSSQCYLAPHSSAFAFHSKRKRKGESKELADGLSPQPCPPSFFTPTDTSRCLNRSQKELAKTPDRLGKVRTTKLFPPLDFPGREGGREEREGGGASSELTFILSTFDGPTNRRRGYCGTIRK